MDVRIRGWEFRVSTGGPSEGIPVVLLHGFPQHSGQWDKVTPILHAAGARTIVPDQRGYSPGARPPSASDYVMSECVADVVSLLDELGIGQAHIVGHDWGAAVAWSFAGGHPDRTLTLTALSVPHLDAFGAALRDENGEQVAMSGYMQVFAQVESAAQMLLAEDGAVFRTMFAGSGMSNEDIEKYLAPMREPGALESALQWYAAVLLEQRTLGPIAAPTTFIWGEQDPALGETGALACGDYVTGDYKFVRLEGIGHWISDQVPDVAGAEIVSRIGLP